MGRIKSNAQIKRLKTVYVLQSALGETEHDENYDTLMYDTKESAQRAIAKMQREELIEDSKLPPEARHTKGGVRDEWSAFRMKVVPWHTGDQKGLFLG